MQGKKTEMQANKVETGYLRQAFRKAFLMGFATIALSVGTMKAQTASDTLAADSTVTDVQKQPWQDASYDREMETAQKVYEAKVDVIHKQADANAVRTSTQQKINVTRVWMGSIRLWYDIRQTKAYKKQAEAQIAQIRATEELQLANLQEQYFRQQQNIDQKYKANYERLQQQKQKTYVMPKTADQKKIDSTQQQLDLQKQQLKLDQQQLKLDQDKQKLEEQRQALNKQKQSSLPNPANKPKG
jgi:stalled ribosome alternative rescue factor ArfA